MTGQDTTTTRREPRKLFFKHVLRKVFLEDWGLKLTALVITLALWFGVTGLSKSAKEEIKVPLNPTVSTDAVITNSIRPEISIFVSGDKRNLDKIARSDLSAGLDLSDIAPGDWVITLSPDNISVNLPQGVTLDRVQPGNVAVKLEAIAEKDLEVKAETTGAVVAGYEVYNSTAVPQKIRVRGPASVVDKLEYVQTDKIDITGRLDGFTAKQIPVNASDPKAAVLNTVVDVFFKIGEKRVERAFTVPTSGSPSKTISFTIYGPRTLVQKARPDSFKVEMFLSETGEQHPKITLPSELQDVADIRKVKLNYTPQ